jgi:hypothetical protein
VLKVPRDARPGIGDSWRSRGRSPERPFRGLPVIARCLEAVIVRSGQRFADLAAPAHIKSRRVCVWAYRYRSPRYWSLSRAFDRGWVWLAAALQEAFAKPAAALIDMSCFTVACRSTPLALRCVTRTRSSGRSGGLPSPMLAHRTHQAEFGARGLEFLGSWF